jgi:hypothetical protein
VFEDRVLRRIFVLRGNDVKGSYRGLSNEEAHKLYSPPSIIRIRIRLVKSRKMRWARHATRRGEEEYV